MSKDWLPYPGTHALAEYFGWDERSEQVHAVSDLCRQAYNDGLCKGAAIVAKDVDTWKAPNVEKESK